MRRTRHGRIVKIVAGDRSGDPLVSASVGASVIGVGSVGESIHGEDDHWKMMINQNQPSTGWWFGCHQLAFSHINIGLLSSSQLTKSYFSEGWPNHQPDPILERFWGSWVSFFRKIGGFGVEDGTSMRRKDGSPLVTLKLGWYFRWFPLTTWKFVCESVLAKLVHYNLFFFRWCGVRFGWYTSQVQTVELGSCKNQIRRSLSNHGGHLKSQTMVYLDILGPKPCFFELFHLTNLSNNSNYRTYVGFLVKHYVLWRSQDGVSGNNSSRRSHVARVLVEARSMDWWIDSWSFCHILPFKIEALTLDHEFHESVFLPWKIGCHGLHLALLSIIQFWEDM